MGDEGSAAAASTIEFEPVIQGGSATLITKGQAAGSLTKLTKSVKDKDAYAKVRASQ